LGIVIVSSIPVFIFQRLFGAERLVILLGLVSNLLFSEVLILFIIFHRSLRAFEVVPSTILGEEPVDQLEEDNEANDNASIVEDGGVFFVAWVEVLGEDKANVGGREEND